MDKMCPVCGGELSPWGSGIEEPTWFCNACGWNTEKEKEVMAVVKEIQDVVDDYNKNRGKEPTKESIRDWEQNMAEKRKAPKITVEVDPNKTGERSQEAMKEKFKEHNRLQRIKENTMTKGRQKKLIKKLQSQKSWWFWSLTGPNQGIINRAMLENILVKLVGVQVVMEERVQDLEYRISVLESKRSLTERIINFFRR